MPSGFYATFVYLLLLVKVWLIQIYILYRVHLDYRKVVSFYLFIENLRIKNCQGAHLLYMRLPWTIPNFKVHVFKTIFVDNENYFFFFTSLRNNTGKQ